jgi:hypothetical protein
VTQNELMTTERCERCSPEFCTYPEHVQYASSTNKQILGTKDALCEGMYHVFPAPEFYITQHGSLTGRAHDNCRPYAMTMVAVCGDLVGRFTNCDRKHAEEFLVSDSRMYHHIRSFRPKAMVLFMKHHPCHHSSGNARRHPNGYLFEGKADKKSCTMQMIRYFRQVLQPNGVQLVIKVAWLYKAFWQHAIREDDKQTVTNSLHGLELMFRAGIQFSEMRPYDWITLANMCTEPVSLATLLSVSRLTIDKGIGMFLRDVESGRKTSGLEILNPDELLREEKDSARVVQRATSAPQSACIMKKRQFANKRIHVVNAPNRPKRIFLGR